MKTTIIGSGAMGSLFGSLLAQSGQDVLLIDICQKHVTAINSYGLIVESNGNIRKVHVTASTTLEDGTNSDLVIIFVKSPHTVQAATKALKCMNETASVLTLQNGMGNADIISNVINPDQVIAGTTAHGATLMGPGRIRHAGTGLTTIGAWSKNETPNLLSIQSVFTAAGIETQIESEIHLVVWKKLIINIGINAITALTGIVNGKIIDRLPTGELVRAAVQEAIDVALAYDIQLPADIVDQVFTIAAATGSNRSSMGQDVDHRRQTEIDAINGAVVRLAKAKGIEAPVNQTLTALVKIVQENYTKDS